MRLGFRAAVISMLVVASGCTTGGGQGAPGESLIPAVTTGVPSTPSPGLSPSLTPGSPSPTGSPTPTPPVAAPLRAKDVMPALLGRAEMPSGWSAGETSKQKGIRGYAPCNRRPYKRSLPVFEVSRALSGPGFRVVRHTIRPFGSVAEATHLMERWRRAAGSCRSFRDADEGRNFNVRRISFTALGDEVVAIELKAARTSKYVPYTSFYVLVRQGQFVSAFRVEAGSSYDRAHGFRSDIGDAERYVSRGARKLADRIAIDDVYEPIPPPGS